MLQNRENQAEVAGKARPDEQRAPDVDGSMAPRMRWRMSLGFGGMRWRMSPGVEGPPSEDAAKASE